MSIFWVLCIKKKVIYCLWFHYIFNFSLFSITVRERLFPHLLSVFLWFFLLYLRSLFFSLFCFPLLLSSHLSILSSHSPACSPVFPSSVIFMPPPLTSASQVFISFLCDISLSLSLCPFFAVPHTVVALSVVRRAPLDLLLRSSWSPYVISLIYSNIYISIPLSS